MTTPASAMPAAPTIQSKLLAVENTLNGLIFERRREAETGTTALIARAHHCSIGAPGIAKSMLVNLLTQLIGDVNYFPWLMTRFTTPEEIFGPVSLKELENDHYIRNTANKLPEAEIAFLDECLTGDTLLLMSDGSRQRLIDIVSSLPSVLTLDNGQIVPATPLRSASRPVQPILRVTLNSGNQVRLTADHKLWVRRHHIRIDEWEDWSAPTWVEAQNINVGVFVAVPNITPVFGVDTLPDHEIDLLGLFIADGGLTRPTIRYTKLDQAMVDLARSTVRSYGDDLIPVNAKDYRVTGRKQQVRSVIHGYGLNRHSPDRFIPDSVFRLPRHQLARFLGILWSGDGTISDSGNQTSIISYATSSPVLAEQVQHLLRRFGIAAKSSQHNVVKPSGQPTVAYRVTVYQGYAETFRAEIGPHTIGSKRMRLMAADLSVKVTERRLQREGQLQWHTVDSIQPDGNEPTFCFTMPTGNFIANDIVVKNCFKANSSILNALLTIMNEGVFYNNGTPSICRPIIFSASNELPREAELAALWDRVTFRHEVKGLKDNQSRKGMMVARYNSRLAQHTLAAVKLTPLVTWTEIQQAQIEAQQVTIPDSVFNAMLDLWSKLSKEGVEPTDRRFNDCIPIIQATAWRDMCTVADVDHMRLLKHVLWTDIAHQPIVERLVLELANPLDKEAMDLMKTIDSLAGEVNTLINDTDNQQQRRRKGVEINGKLTRAGKDLDELFEKAKNSPRRCDMIQEARVRLGSIVQLMLKELFGISDPGQTP